MSATASSIPARFLAGMTQDQEWQPLADCGAGNPAFYHTFFTDLDSAYELATGNRFTLSGTSATFANATTGPGGLATLSTEAVADQIAQIQGEATFSQNIAPKKLFFAGRVPAITNLAANNWVMGLVNSGAAITAATGALAVTSGTYFSYVGSTSTLKLNTTWSGSTQSVTIPAAAYNLSASFDLGFYVTRQGDIAAFIDTDLVGYIPQNLLGTTGNPLGAGPIGRILGTAYTAGATLLAPTVCTWNSNGTASTMTLDFITAAQER